MTDALIPNEWNLSKKISFRFCFLFFGLLIFPFPLSYLPMIGEYSELFLGKLWNGIIPWAGKTIFGLKEAVNIEQNGSGDTTYLYIQLFLIVVISALACIIWSFLDRKRKAYTKLFSWFYLAVRYYLAFTMFTYGFAKVFQSQFPFPSLGQLEQPLRNFSPMGLAWTYMGYSEGFNFFAGGMEVLGGLLLMFGRTGAFGSLVTIAVMTNVAAMNFCYDIPVKLYSTELILMGIFILAPDLKNISGFFFLKKSSALISHSPNFKNKKMRIASVAGKYLLFTFVFGSNFYEGYTMAEEAHNSGSRSPLYGIYKVENFVRNNDTIPPLETDSTRWKKMILEWPEYAQISLMPGPQEGFSMSLDTIKKTGEMFSFSDTTNIFSFAYKTPEKEKLEFKGIFGKDTVKINFRRLDEKKFLLVSRGFHWINEYPFNR